MKTIPNRLPSVITTDKSDFNYLCEHVEQSKESAVLSYSPTGQYPFAITCVIIEGERRKKALQYE
jgi:hypothetical protein